MLVQSYLKTFIFRFLMVSMSRVPDRCFVLFWYFFAFPTSTCDSDFHDFQRYSADSDVQVDWR